MNRIDRGILIGMVLGDGCLSVFRDKRYTNSFHQRLTLKHGASQKEYIEYKRDLLHSIFGGKKPKVKEINNNGYLGYTVSKSNSYFRVLHKQIYPSRKKCISRKVLDKLTPHGIAIWYMDDGSLYPKKRNGKIHAYELILNTYIPIEENEIIIDYFKENYDINFKIAKSKGSFRLRLGTREARKFIKIVEPYIIDSMKYKIKIN